MDERSPRIGENEIFVLVDDQGEVARVSAGAESSLTDEELARVAAEALRAVAEVGDAGRAHRAIDIGDLEIVPVSGDDGDGFLVTITGAGKSHLQALTPRQRQIAQLAANGKSVAEVAWETGVSTNTVKYHLKRIYKLLDVSTRLELAALFAPDPGTDDG